MAQSPQQELSMSEDEQKQLAIDFQFIHYREHGGTSWCGAWRRLHELINAGKLSEKNEKGKYYSFLIQATTDIRRVTCGKCQYIIRNYVTREWE